MDFSRGWANIELKEAYKRCQPIIIDDFGVGGGIPRIQWPEPGDKEIGQFCFKSVSQYYVLIFLFFSICYE